MQHVTKAKLRITVAFVQKRISFVYSTIRLFRKTYREISVGRHCECCEDVRFYQKTLNELLLKKMFME